MRSEVQVEARQSNVVPTIKIEDTDVESKKVVASDTSQTVQEVQQDVPGALPHGPAPAIPDWYRVGWRQVSGIDDVPPEGQEKERTVLDAFLSEQFYGSWYHNAAIIIFVSSCTIPQMFQNIFHTYPGRICLSFLYSLQFWMGLAVHHSRRLQHILHDIPRTCPQGSA